MYEKYKAATLTWVNSIRDQAGMPLLAELPCGHPRTGCHCPVARALSGVLNGAKIEAFVSKREWWWNHDDMFHGRPLGPWVHEFIEAFDDHRYPELVA